MKKIFKKVLFVCPIILFSVSALLLFENRKSNQLETEQNKIVDSSVKRTEIIKYEQINVPEKTEEGSCWSTSISSRSGNAYRCSVGEFIYDPCFVTPSNKIVCGIDPEDPSDGFTLTLKDSIIHPDEIKYKTQTDQVANREPSGEGIRPWIIKLENGHKCNIQTGTAGDVEGIQYFYYCNRDETVVLLGDLGETIDRVISNN